MCWMVFNLKIFFRAPILYTNERATFSVWVERRYRKRMSARLFCEIEILFKNRALIFQCIYIFFKPCLVYVR